MIIGDYIENVKCESFKDPETGRICVSPLAGLDLSIDMVIECCSTKRKVHPIGTKFKTENVKVCRKPNGRIYLRAKDQVIIKIE